MPEIIRSVEEMGWMCPTPVQAEAIPLILGGGDVCVAAETGSGKTGAFCLPTLQIVHESLSVPSEEFDAEPVEEAGGGWAWSGRDRDALLEVDAADATRCAARHTHQWVGARATRGIREGAGGRWCFEVAVEGDGLCRVGWSTADSTLALGTDAHSYAYGGTGKKSSGGSFETYGESFGRGDVIACALDLDAGEVRFFKNGIDLGMAYSWHAGDLQGRALYPTVLLKSAQVHAHFQTLQHSYVGDYRAVAAAAAATASQTATPAQEGALDLQGRDRPGNAPLLLALEPTRELALQVEAELRKFARYLPETDAGAAVHIECFVGGMPSGAAAAAASGTVGSTGRQRLDIAICTAGRLTECLKTGRLDVRSVRFLALDEADALIAQGSAPLIYDLLRRIPQTGRRHRLQVVLFSATLHSGKVRQLSDRVQQHATWVDTKGMDSVPDTVDHLVLWVTPDTARTVLETAGDVHRWPDTDDVHRQADTRGDDADALSLRAKRAKPLLLAQLIERYRMEQAIFFCRTQLDCTVLHRFLERPTSTRGASVVLHGGLAAAERRQNLARFKDGEYRFLICTDVAARGIDVVGLPYVVNMTLPDEPDGYVHRVGRVGRADHTGLALSLVSSVPERVWFHTACRGRRGANCQNRALTTEGGCTLWLDEAEVVRQIAEQVGGGSGITEVPDVMAFLRDGHGATAQKVVYGVKRGEGSGGGANTSAGAAEAASVREQMERLRPTLEWLQTMERQAQLWFLGHAGGKPSPG